MDGKKGDPTHNKNVGVNRTLKTKWPLKHTAANRNINIDVGVIVRMCKCWPMTNRGSHICGYCGKGSN